MKKCFFINKHYSFKDMLNVFFVTVLSVVLLSGCTDEQIDLKKSISVKGTTDWITPYSFNWEDPNLNWMPYPAGQALIPLPWNGQGSLSSTFDPDVLNDRKASDGWILLYSTFSPTILSYNPYFILYNKYRGLMRVFLYVNNTSFASSSYMKNAISQPTNQYSILNFAGSDIVDVSKNQTVVTKIEQAPKDGSNAPFSAFKWYMLQYELAYDPTIAATSSTNPPQLSFNVNSIDISQVSLGGTAVGSLKGTIGATGPTDIFSTISGNILKPIGNGVIAAVGSQALSRFKTNETTNSMGLPNPIFKAVSTGVTAALSTAAGNLPGAVLNILSGIFGGSSGSAGQTVSLNLNANISLAGTLTNTTGLPSTPASFYFPGSLLVDAGGNYNVQGYVPLYNKPLGVFNLSNTPMVDRYIIDNYVSAPYSGPHYSMFSKIDQTSFHIDWNPEVLQNATISNVNYEIIISNYTLSSDNPFYPFPNYTEYLSDVSGNWSNLIVYNNDKAGDVQTVLVCSNYDEYPMIRISFNVIPNNGAPTVTIVKTFRAKYNNIWGATEFYNNII